MNKFVFNRITEAMDLAHMGQVPVTVAQISKSEEEIENNTEMYDKIAISDELRQLLGEALADNDRYITPEVIEYMYKQLESPEERKAFISRIKKYSSMASNCSDRQTALMYEYLRFLPPEAAKNFAREFYQKETRSGTFSNMDNIEGDEGELPTNKFYDVDTEVGNIWSGVGVFNSVVNSGNLDKEIETESIFDLLFNGTLLGRAEKIVLITNLMFGVGPGMRSRKGTSRVGLDLRQVLTKTPPELKEVENRIKFLVSNGWDEEDITAEDIISGSTVDGKFNAGLIGSKAKAKAQAKIIEVVTELAEETGLDVGTMILGESSDKDNDKIADKKFLAALDKLMAGDKIAGSDLITLLVRAIYSNLKIPTKFSQHNPLFKKYGNNIKSLVRKYLEMAKLGGDYNWSEIQAMVLAPVLRYKLKDKNI